MWPHFSGTINLGDIVIAASILLAALRVLTAFDSLAMEHEMLIDDYCERKGIKRKELLTRRRRHPLTILLGAGRRD